MLHEMLPFNSNCLSKVAKRHADFAIRLPVGRTISKTMGSIQMMNVKTHSINC